MKTEILEKIIKSDKPELEGYSADHFPIACSARVECILTYLERYLSDEELSEVESEVKGTLGKATNVFRQGECAYYLFEDRSLYFSSNAQSEVWADATDFAVERIINGYDHEITGMDEELLNHLGGHVAEEVASRKS